MANDELHHVALPKLYGAPAYARPPVEPVARSDRPFDPDELPLESALTDEERQLLQEQSGRSAIVAEAAPDAARQTSRASGGLPFRLPSITGLLRGGGSVTGVVAAGSVTGMGNDLPVADAMAIPVSAGSRVTITGDTVLEDDAARPIAADPEPEHIDESSAPVGE